MDGLYLLCGDYFRHADRFTTTNAGYCAQSEIPTPPSQAPHLCSHSLLCNIKVLFNITRKPESVINYYETIIHMYE